jgi:hypothetical protein
MRILGAFPGRAFGGCCSPGTGLRFVARAFSIMWGACLRSVHSPSVVFSECPVHALPTFLVLDMRPWELQILSKVCKQISAITNGEERKATKANTPSAHTAADPHPQGASCTGPGFGSYSRSPRRAAAALTCSPSTDAQKSVE